MVGLHSCRCHYPLRFLHSTQCFETKSCQTVLAVAVAADVQLAAVRQEWGTTVVAAAEIGISCSVEQKPAPMDAFPNFVVVADAGMLVDASLGA